MADVPADIDDWSEVAGNNTPTGDATIGAGLDDNLRQIQATVKKWIYVPTQGVNNFHESIAFGSGLRNLANTVPGTDGVLNTAVGFRAMTEATTARYCTAVGNGALHKNTTGISNTAVGTSALYENTTANYNTGVGLDALQFNTTGTENTAIGKRSNWQQTTGNNNTSVGVDTLFVNLTGSSNTAIGHNALNANTASNNVAIGASALVSNTSGSENCALGRAALLNNTTGNSNVAIGNNAGRYRSDGSTALGTVTSSVFIGEGARGGSADGQSNVISIGVNAVGGGSNTATIGNTDIATTRLQGRIGIGTSTFGTDASGPMITLLSATAVPTTAPADTVTLYSQDGDVAGNTLPSWYCEGTEFVATGQADSVSSVRVKMRINGTIRTFLCI